MKNKKWLTRINHVTYACRPETVDEWVRFHTEIEGGAVLKHKPDVYPNNPHSSMKLWCIDFGGFVVDLIVGIDREGKSHITEFVELHGDHCVQHIAFETPNLEEYVNHLQDHGVQILGDAHAAKLERDGIVQHIFTKGYSGEGVKNMPFAEYMQITKVDMTAENRERMAAEHAPNLKEDLYTHITESIQSGDRGTLLETKV